MKSSFIVLVQKKFCYKLFIKKIHLLYSKMLQTAYCFTRLAAVFSARWQIAVDPCVWLAVLNPQVCSFTMTVAVNRSTNDCWWVRKMFYNQFQTLINALLGSNWCTWISYFSFLNKSWEAIRLFTWTFFKLATHKNCTRARRSIAYLISKMRWCSRKWKFRLEIILEAQLATDNADEEKCR